MYKAFEILTGLMPTNTHIHTCTPPQPILNKVHTHNQSICDLHCLPAVRPSICLMSKSSLPSSMSTKKLVRIVLEDSYCAHHPTCLYNSRSELHERHTARSDHAQCKPAAHGSVGAAGLLLLQLPQMFKHCCPHVSKLPRMTDVGLPLFTVAVKRSTEFRRLLQCLKNPELFRCRYAHEAPDL